MKKQKKFQYVPCELRIAEFNVERGFANASPITPIGAFANVENIWTMEDNDNNTHFENEKYDAGIDWFGGSGVQNSGL